MKAKDIKHQIKSASKKKKIEVNSEFYNKMAVFCLNKELHIATLYKIMTLKGMDQMLMTMRDEAIQEYELHEPTLDKINDIKELINSELNKKGLKERLI